MSRTLVLVVLIAFACTMGVLSAENAAQYRVIGVTRDGEPPISDVWIMADGSEMVDGKPYRWWRLIMQKPDGSVLGIRALSEYVPMTSPAAPGKVARYIYSPQPDLTIEYVDQSTRRALLPEFGLGEVLLPTPPPDARIIEGFASTGGLLGHPMARMLDTTECPSVDFRKVKRLNIRTDFHIGTARTFKDDGVTPKPGENWGFVDWDENDIRAMIDAGFNYMLTTPRIRQFIENEPVFFRAAMTYPDDLYRSNFLTTPMFIDEPMVLLGWPGPTVAPEAVMHALRLRVQQEQSIRHRVLGARTGGMDVLVPRSASWDTEYWSAWYQLQAGVPSLVHEGRYVHRGYGWEPEYLLGSGLDKLTDRDQFNSIYAFMRGAARAFDGDWGTSIYGQSDVELRLPAMIRAYEMGAKYLWYWTSDHDHHMPFPEQLRLTREFCDHAAKNPRPARESLLRQAEVGIALPAGYAWTPWGISGMWREDPNEAGVSYGDIAAALAFEGLLCSRKGIEFDFLVDHPNIDKLGYKRLVKIREDGSLEVIPAWTEQRAPKNLRIEAKEAEPTLISGRMDADSRFRVNRAREMKIDADLSDWSNAEWVTLDGSEWFGDNIQVDLSLTVPETNAGWEKNKYLGMIFEPSNAELMEKYFIEAWPHETYVVVTGVEPGSPAEEAGLREGDFILSMANRTVKYDMHIHQIADQNKNNPGTKIPMTVRRNTQDLYGGDADLSAETAFLVDDSYLYFAAKVRDDVHSQGKRTRFIWRHDCVQIGVDPILDRNTNGMGENNHKIGFALHDGKPILWRWDGRRGQPTAEMKNVRTSIVRRGDMTFYEAAIPLTDLMPIAPDTWRKVGLNVAVNDNDDGRDARKGRLELVQGAMTKGNNPDRFAVFEFAPSGNQRKVSGSLVWGDRCMQPGGSADLSLVVSSPQTAQATVRAELSSLDTPQTAKAVAETRIGVSPDPKQYTLRVSSDSPPGRYNLRVSVFTDSGWKVAEDALNVYIYP